MEDLCSALQLLRCSFQFARSRSRSRQTSGVAGKNPELWRVQLLFRKASNAGSRGHAAGKAEKKLRWTGSGFTLIVVNFSFNQLGMS